MKRCMALKGAVGVFIHSYTSTTLIISHIWMRRLWILAAAIGLPFHLHTRSQPPDQQEVYRDYEFMTGSAYRFIAHAGIRLLRMMLAGVFDRNSSL
jgi:hypothetical protein